MKEATGELNMTVITVVAVVAVGAFFTVFVLPGLQQNIQGQTICNNGPRYKNGTSGTEGYVSCGTVNASSKTFTCMYAAASKDRNGNVTYTNKSLTCKDQ